MNQVATFRSTLAGLVEQQQLPGALAAAVLADGAVVSGAVGFADKELNQPMLETHRILSASIGKSFVAAMAVALQGEGRLNLDSSISTFLGMRPWFERLPNARYITLRSLLNHSSGIPDHIYEPKHAEFRARRFMEPEFAFRPEELVGFILDATPLFPADGTHFSYSDTSYIVAGLILETVLGRPYYDELQDRFLGPLMLNSTLPSNKRAIPLLASGYLTEGGPFGRAEGMPEKTVIDGLMIFNPANEWTGGGLATHPRDLTRWAKALYEERAFHPPYLQELLTVNPDREAAIGRTGGAYGLGVIVRESEFGPVYGHTGGMPGYSGFMSYYPKYRIALSMQVNQTTFDIRQSELALARLVVRELSI